MIKRRNNIIDITKFTSAIIIMALHRSVLGYGDGYYYFKDAWIYVEFFLMVTGYYTARHFDSYKYDNVSLNCLKYWICKFLPLIPYTTIAIATQWIVFGIVQIQNGIWTLKDFVFMLFEDLTIEVLLLPAQGDYFVGPMWYITALFIAFPLFLWVVCLKNKYVRIFISVLYPLSYYGIVGAPEIIAFPRSVLRILAGLFLGELIFEVLSFIDEWLNSRNVHVLLTIEFIIFFMPVYLTCKNTKAFRFEIICFFLFLIIAFSESVKCTLNSELLGIFGELSMPIYVLHLVVGTILEYYKTVISYSVRLFLYYVVTFFISWILMMSIKRCRIVEKAICLVKEIE